MSNDLYNLIYGLLEGYRIDDRAKIATELHDGVESLMNNRCGEGACYADVYLKVGEDRPAEQDAEFAKLQDEDNELLKYQTLTQAYQVLANAQLNLDALAKVLDDDFKPADTYFHSPIQFNANVEHVMGEASRSFTDFVIGKMQPRYKNLRIKSELVHKFVKEKGRFDAVQVIRYIKALYDTDEDAESLRQIKAICKELLPHGRFTDGIGASWEMANKPEHIPKLGDVGFQLKCYSDPNHRLKALVKLIAITLGDEKPSQVEGFSMADYPIGSVFANKYIKSLRYFKNNAVKVIFYKPEDAEKVKFALVS